MSTRTKTPITTTTKPKNRPAGSIKKLAAGLNVSERRAQQLLADGMPAELGAARLWRREHSALPADYLASRARKMAAAAELAELELSRQKGLLVSRAEVKLEAEGIAAAVSAFARKIEVELPQLLLGLPLERSRPITKQVVREMLLMLKDKQSEFWAAHPETTGK
jgi:hypothetical protein